MNKQQIIDLCRAAGQIGDVTHEEFAEYVIPINNRKRVDGEWKNVEMPYMQVDGRVAMARTDHRRQGKKLDIMPTQIVIDNNDTLTVQVTIESEVYGKSTGLATSKKTNQNAEGQFPFEVAETSAIGRALALYGYGVFAGTGLTSAEDMRRVNERSFSQRESDKKNEKSSQTTQSNPKQADSRPQSQRTHPPLSSVQKSKMVELWKTLHGGTNEDAVKGLDGLFVETFKHGIEQATYEDGARLTGQLLSEIRSKTQNNGQDSASTAQAENMPAESNKAQTESSQNGASQTTQTAQNVKTDECPTHHTPTIWFEKQKKWAHKIEGTKDWCYETPKG